MNNLSEQRCLPQHALSCAREALWDTMQLHHAPAHPVCLPQQQHTSLEKKLESENVRGWKESPKSLIWQPRGQSSGQPLAWCLAGSTASSPDSPLLWFALLIFKGKKWGEGSFFFSLFFFFSPPLQSFVFIFVTVGWKCSRCGKRWFWPHVPPGHDEGSEAVLVREGVAGAARAGPAQASLGRGRRGPLLGFLDLQQDLGTTREGGKSGIVINKHH